MSVYKLNFTQNFQLTPSGKLAINTKSEKLCSKERQLLLLMRKQDLTSQTLCDKLANDEVITCLLNKNLICSKHHDANNKHEATLTTLLKSKALIPTISLNDIPQKNETEEISNIKTFMVICLEYTQQNEENLINKIERAGSCKELTQLYQHWETRLLKSHLCIKMVNRWRTKVKELL